MPSFSLKTLKVLLSSLALIAVANPIFCPNKRNKAKHSPQKTAFCTKIDSETFNKLSREERKLAIADAEKLNRETYRQGFKAIPQNEQKELIDEISIDLAADFFISPLATQVEYLKITLFPKLDRSLQSLKNVTGEFKYESSLLLALENTCSQSLILGHFLWIFKTSSFYLIHTYTSFKIIIQLRHFTTHNVFKLQLALVPVGYERENNFINQQFQEDANLWAELQALGLPKELTSLIIFNQRMKFPVEKIVAMNESRQDFMSQQINRGMAISVSRRLGTGRESLNLDPNYCANEIQRLKQEAALIEAQKKDAKRKKVEIAVFTARFGELNTIFIDEKHETKPDRPNTDRRNRPTPPEQPTIQSNCHEECPTQHPEGYNLAQELAKISPDVFHADLIGEKAEPPVDNSPKTQPFKIMVHDSIEFREKLKNYINPLLSEPQNRGDGLSGDLAGAFSKHYKNNTRRLLFTINDENKIIFILRDDSRKNSYKGDQKTLGAWIKKLRVKDLTPDILSEFYELNFDN